MPRPRANRDIDPLWSLMNNDPVYSLYAQSTRNGKISHLRRLYSFTRDNYKKSFTTAQSLKGSINTDMIMAFISAVCKQADANPDSTRQLWQNIQLDVISLQLLDPLERPLFIVRKAQMTRMVNRNATGHDGAKAPLILDTRLSIAPGRWAQFAQLFIFTGLRVDSLSSILTWHLSDQRIWWRCRNLKTTGICQFPPEGYIHCNCPVGPVVIQTLYAFLAPIYVGLPKNRNFRATLRKKDKWGSKNATKR